MAVYLGESDEDKINNMSIPFFNGILKMLGKRINYDAVVNLAGNSFAKDAWKAIQEANPMMKEKKLSSGFLDMIASVAPKATTKDMNDMDWINNVD